MIVAESSIRWPSKGTVPRKIFHARFKTKETAILLSTQDAQTLRESRHRSADGRLPGDGAARLSEELLTKCRLDV